MADIYDVKGEHYDKRVMIMQSGEEAQKYGRIIPPDGTPAGFRTFVRWVPNPKNPTGLPALEFGTEPVPEKRDATKVADPKAEAIATLAKEFGAMSMADLETKAGELGVRVMPAMRKQAPEPTSKASPLLAAKVAEKVWESEKK